MGIKSDILDNIISTLESISIADGYSLDIQNVKKIALPTEKLNAQERISSCLISFARETKYKANQFSDDLMFNAIALFAIRASMDNITQNVFLDFMEDIEAVLSKDGSRGGLTDDHYIVKETWISEIDMVVTEEFNQEAVQEAILMVNVSYSYIPLKLSGTSDRLG